MFFWDVALKVYLSIGWDRVVGVSANDSHYDVAYRLANNVDVNALASVEQSYMKV